MSVEGRYKIPIPKGFRIYDTVEVAGISYRLDKFIEIMRRPNKAFFSMTLDPKNKHDRNAIKVIGCRKKLIGTVVRHVGFVPAGIAEQIAKSENFSSLRLRARSYWIGDRGGARLEVDILGPRDGYKKYMSNSLMNREIPPSD